MATTTDFAVEKPTVGGYRNSWGGTLNVALDKLTELLALAIPLGSVQMYTKSTAPTATTNGGTWLVCDGSAISRTTYSALYAVIGTTYGVGDGSNTFNIPDMRARVPVGYNTATITGRSTRAIALGSGAETHTLLDAEIPKHTHPVGDSGHNHAITDSGHSHTGTTNKAKADIVLEDHTHQLQKWTDDTSGGDITYSGRGNLLSSVFLNPHRRDGDATTETVTGDFLLKEDGASNNGHQHSFTTDPKVTGLSVDNNTTGVTVNEQGTGDGSHNNMQPFLVVNYIILAKHPSF
jgi:microcystin-dependent protein